VVVEGEQPGEPCTGAEGSQREDLQLGEQPDIQAEEDLGKESEPHRKHKAKSKTQTIKQPGWLKAVIAAVRDSRLQGLKFHRRGNQKRKGWSQSPWEKVPNLFQYLGRKSGKCLGWGYGNMLETANPATICKRGKPMYVRKQTVRPRDAAWATAFAKLTNWTAPGLDGIQDFWLTAFPGVQLIWEVKNGAVMAGVGDNNTDSKRGNVWAIDILPKKQRSIREAA
jgi:hypothetical protein